MTRITDKKLIRQSEVWRQNAVMAPAAYRLYVYTKVEYIPEEIAKAMKEEIIESWDEQISFENIEADIEMTMGAIFKSLANQKIMEAFLFIPIIIADIFVLQKGAGQLEGKYRIMLDEYADMVHYDRPLAEIDAIYSIAEFLKEVAKKINIKLTYDVDEIVSRIITQKDLINKSAQSSSGLGNLDEIINKALKEYEEATGESALKDVEEGVDIEELESVKEKILGEETNVS